MSTQEQLQIARKARRLINLADTLQKNQILEAMARGIETHCEDILQANERDVAHAKGQLSEVMIDRLALNLERLEAMVAGLRALIELSDPVGRVLEKRELENGLQLQKQTVPFGVIGLIYESRPNVTADAAGLCVKSGNACVLRGGKDAFLSSQAIITAMKAGIEALGISSDFIQLIQDTSRQSALEMMQAKGLIDLLIPRGGAGLIQAVVTNALVPVIETGTGICHLYVDRSADLDQALLLLENAKMSRPSVCNAVEVCLVHQEVAPLFLPKVAEKLVVNRTVAGQIPLVVKGDASVQEWIPQTLDLDDGDFDREYLDYILAIKIVSSLEEAVQHIDRHSTGHSEAIVTKDSLAAQYFTDQVDSAAVYVNASTRFTDGGKFGLGCEMGISTQKMHARGPMGLNELVSYKYIIEGNGQIR